MPIPLIDKIKPKNGGKFAMADAEDIEMPDGQRLDKLSLEWFLKILTQAEYDAMVEAGTIDENMLYLIREENAK